MFDALQIDPVAFTIPIGENGIAIFWYGILVVIGIAIGTFWAAREIEKRRADVDEFYTGLLIAVVSGYFFARLAYVLLDVLDGNSARYATALDVLNIRSGGVNILGGFVGAAVVVLIYARWRKMPIWKYADVVGPTVLIAQAIGRWGNFINQELYGPPTTLPWGILIESGNRIAPYQRPGHLPGRHALPPDLSLRVHLAPGRLHSAALFEQALPRTLGGRQPFCRLHDLVGRRTDLD